MQRPEPGYRVADSGAHCVLIRYVNTLEQNPVMPGDPGILNFIQVEYSDIGAGINKPFYRCQTQSGCAAGYYRCFARNIHTVFQEEFGR